MKVRAGGRGKTERFRMCRKRSALMRLVARRIDFERRAAVIAEFSDEFPHLLRVEIVAPGMRDYRAAA